jgi:hypothetical protein
LGLFKQQAIHFHIFHISLSSGKANDQYAAPMRQAFQTAIYKPDAVEY